MITPAWYPIFYKEMPHFKRKLGYIFSAMVAPIIHLVAFGLDRSDRIGAADYPIFLLPELVAMSSMNNSYTWASTYLNFDRVYFKPFHIYVQAPISPPSIMT
jgi:hypothetical protein